MNRDLSAYFGQIQSALKRAKLAEPVLVVDRRRLNANIKQLVSMLPPGMAFRIVAKSLPCAPLISHIAARTGTDRLMSFNAAMALQMLDLMPKADQLMGKPLPVAAVSALFDTLGPRKQKAAARQIQFLVDTPARLIEMGKLARKRQITLRINLEIDVGLHRGGMEAGLALDAALSHLAQTPNLELSGLMGYEPHLSKLPKLAGWRRRARAGAVSAYVAARAQVAQYYSPAQIEKMTFNTAGSPTFGLYTAVEHANEISAGSALVKPSDFDLPLLQGFEPAAFIATPALKVSQGVRLPALEHANNLLGKTQSGSTIFIHGGYWMAQAVFPPRLKNSALFGRSSNQEMLVGPTQLKLSVDDFVFLRPNQSEAVFLQFPKIAVFDGRRIADIWQPLPVSA
ncbi:MAG TPA: alanine racemase [Rhodobiaceae bacterium]|nr:MAG: Uncharacterised protein [Rhodobiaceae bacterium UBA7378]HCQ82014.1 alanine racemase [Rhodobiaceae bacterium]